MRLYDDAGRTVGTGYQPTRGGTGGTNPPRGEPDGTYKPAPENPWAPIAAAIAETVQVKNAAYGDAFGRTGVVMRELYPDGIPPTKLDDALAVVRVLDKLFRIAADRDALGESPWRDIAGYALLAVKRVEDKGPA